jgi:hypothetical protein
MSKYRIFHAVESRPLLYGISGINNILNTLVYLVGVMIGALFVSKLNRILGFSCLFLEAYIYWKMKNISKEKIYNQQKKTINKPRIIQIRNSQVFRY